MPPQTPSKTLPPGGQTQIAEGGRPVLLTQSKSLYAQSSTHVCADFSVCVKTLKKCAVISLQTLRHARGTRTRKQQGMRTSWPLSVRHDELVIDTAIPAVSVVAV